MVASFMNVLSQGIPLARKHPEDFESMWSQLADSLDQLLFPKKYIFNDENHIKLVSKP